MTESGPGGVGVIEGRGQFLQGVMARGPAQQPDLAELPDRVIEIRVGAFDGLVRLADLLPARGASVRVCRKDNMNHRVIAPVERSATALRAERGLAPLPTGLSAHVFRRTYITLMTEAGAPITYVQDQVGHESARLTLEIYARVSRSRDRAKWGRAFDEIMAGAVPAEAYEPVEQIALFAVDEQTMSLAHVPATTKGDIA